MSLFRDQLRALQTQPGVHAVVAAGRDGLLIDHAPGADLAAAEHLAALAPGLVAAAEMLADTQRESGLRSVVVESGMGVIVALPVTPEVTILVAIDAAHAGAAETIGHVRAERRALAESV